MAEKVTIGNCELWHGACRRIEQAYAQPRLFEDAKVGAGDTAVQGDLLLPAPATYRRVPVRTSTC